MTFLRKHRPKSPRSQEALVDIFAKKKTNLPKGRVDSPEKGDTPETTPPHSSPKQSNLATEGYCEPMMQVMQLNMREAFCNDGLVGATGFPRVKATQGIPE